MASNKGKFVNTFSSMQMLGDYENETEETDINSQVHDENNIRSPINIPPENGDDLYNPLEGMDDDNEDVKNNITSIDTAMLSEPPNDTLSKHAGMDDIVESHEPFKNIIDSSHTEIVNHSSYILNHSNQSEGPIFQDDELGHDLKDLSDLSSKEDEGESREQEEKIIQELKQEITKSKDTDFLDDQDELLGTALAELEMDERERQLQLEIVVAQENGTSSNKKTKKKKKKTKSKDKSFKDDEKDSKKRKKKRKKKKNKEKDIEEGKKKKKEKKLRESDMGIEELLERIKEEEEKEQIRKSEKKKSKLVKSSAKKHKEEQKEKRKDLDSKVSTKNKEYTKKEDRSSERKRSLSGERRDELKERKDHSHRKRYSKDPSDDHKSKRFRDRSPDNRKDPSDGHKSKRSRDKSPNNRKVPSDEHKSKQYRDRSPDIHKNTSNDHKIKRSRDKSPDNYLKQASTHNEQSRDHKKTKHGRRDSSEERINRRRQSGERRISHSEKDKKSDPYKDNRLDYEIKVPEILDKDEKHDKIKEFSPPLSKEEFYRLQHKVRNGPELEKQKPNPSSSSSDSSSSVSDSEADKTLHRSSFNEIYSVELKNFEKEVQNERHKKPLPENVNEKTSVKRRDTIRKDSKRHSTSKDESHSPYHTSHKSASPDRSHTSNSLLSPECRKKTSEVHSHLTNSRKHSFNENNDSMYVNLSQSSAVYQPDDISEDNDSIDMQITSVEDTTKTIQETNKSIHVEPPSSIVINNHSQPFESVSSLSENDDSIEMSEEKPLKPGQLSLRQYKERRRSGKKVEQSGRDNQNIASEHHSIETERERKHSHSDTASYDFANKENVPHSSNPTYSPKTKHNEEPSIVDDNLETRFPKENGGQSIPLLFDDSKEGKSLSVESGNDQTKSPHVESPYNPEASPIDIGSPSFTLDDKSEVEFKAYKDVVAFNDIMKSKVKHEAKKHKRRKLEELQAQMGTHTKDGKLVDYLVRQAQVEEEMKRVLKQFFKAREITKEEYKDILKKAVPQVTMSSSAIIPEKIESLMQKFVRKCKGNRAKEDKKRRKEQKELAEQQKQLQIQLQNSAAMFQQIRVLNPNLPMPPM